jgi:sugar phosphate isomerase/epimerase
MTMMQIGARQDCVAGGDIGEKMAILKRLGYDFIEVSLTRDEIGALTSVAAAPYRKFVEQTGLPIRSTSFGHFGGFAALGAEQRRGIVDDIRRMIRFTHDVGADAMLLATREESADVSSYTATYREALLPLADEAAQAGVMLVLEHVGWYKPYLLAQVVRAINHPAVRIYFDMGNCLYVGENPLEQARICGPLTGLLHIKGGPVAPLAAMPLVGVRETLEAAGFHGRGCLEIEPAEGNRPLAEARGLLKMAGYW